MTRQSQYKLSKRENYKNKTSIEIVTFIQHLDDIVKWIRLTYQAYRKYRKRLFKYYV